MVVRKAVNRNPDVANVAKCVYLLTFARPAVPPARPASDLKQSSMMVMARCGMSALLTASILSKIVAASDSYSSTGRYSSGLGRTSFRYVAQQTLRDQPLSDTCSLKTLLAPAVTVHSVQGLESGASLVCSRGQVGINTRQPRHCVLQLLHRTCICVHRTHSDVKMNASVWTHNTGADAAFGNAQRYAYRCTAGLRLDLRPIASYSTTH